MAARRAHTLPVRLIMASVFSAAAVAAVCGLSLVSLGDLFSVTRDSVKRQLALLDDASAFESLLYQKGFVAEYMLTRDRRALDRLQASREAYLRSFARMRAAAAGGPAADLLTAIESEYAAYDGARGRIIALFDTGRQAEAVALLPENLAHTQRILRLGQEFAERERGHAERMLQQAQRTQRRLAWLLAGASLAGALSSLAAGFLLARRLGERLRAADAVLEEQRQRLLQSEKLSAVGELAAKLAHEILNPLAGMKTTVQLMARRSAGGGLPGEQALATAESLDGEIGRVEELLQRLCDYARPLSPRIRVTPLARLLQAAQDAARPELARNGAAVRCQQEPELPPLEVDPLLMTQVLANLLGNAAQARPGGTIELRAGRAQDPEREREYVRIEVLDEGPGIAPEHLPRLFQPFFTTKPHGHGLGLAVSQNIVLLHGGRLLARNRDGQGAVFEVQIPILR